MSINFITRCPLPIADATRTDPNSTVATPRTPRDRETQTARDSPPSCSNYRAVGPRTARPPHSRRASPAETALQSQSSDKSTPPSLPPPPAPQAPPRAPQTFDRPSPPQTAPSPRTRDTAGRYPSPRYRQNGCTSSRPPRGPSAPSQTLAA